MIADKKALLGRQPDKQSSGSQAGRWMAQYYDKLAEIETSVKNLQSYIKFAQQKNNLERSELDGVFSRFSKKEKEIIDNLDYHLPRIQAYLDGGGNDHEKGILQLIEDQKKAAKEYLKQLERNQTESTNHYRQLLVQYNSEMARLWNEVANLLPGVQHLASEAIHMRENTVKQLAENFSQYVTNYKKIVDEGRDVIYEFIALRDILNFLNQFREVHQQELIDELELGIPTKNSIKRETPTQIAKNFFAGSTPKVLMNELQHFKNISEEASPQQVDDETKQELREFVKKAHKILFKNSKYEKSIEEKEISDDIESQLERFKKNLSSLYEYLAKDYGNMSSEQFYNLILFPEKGMFSAFSRRKNNSKGLSLKQIWERANEKDKDANKLLKQANEKISELLQGKGWDQFIAMQPNDSTVGKKRDAGKRQQVFDEYWKKYGANIQRNFQGFGKEFENAHLYLLRHEFQLEELYNLYLMMAQRIQNLYDPSTNIKNLNNVSGIKKRFIDYFQAMKRSRETEIENLKSEISKIKGILQSFQQSAQGKEEAINKLYERIKEVEEFIREENNRFETEIEEDARNRRKEKQNRVKPDENRIKDAEKKISQYYQDIQKLREELEQLRNSQTGESYEQRNIAQLQGELESKTQELEQLQEFIKVWNNEIAQQYNQVVLLIERYGEFLSIIVNNKEHFKKQYIDKVRQENESDDYVWKSLNRNFTYLGSRSSSFEEGSDEEGIPPNLFDISGER